jgi:tRNA pseudouridine55 synthase
MDTMVPHWPAVALDAETSRLFLNGQAVTVIDAPLGDLLRVYDDDHAFLGIGRNDGKGRLAPRRVVAL